jgi:hypothetical protein
MKTHRYLRAYMAGIVVPTVVVAFALVVFFIARYVYQVPIPIERVVIFPMALVPTLFGLWNMFYVRLGTGRRLPLGVHGALLPVMMIPLGATGAVALQFLSFGSKGIVWFNTITIPYILLAPWFAVVLIAYYLIWKYLVGFCNRILEIM